MMTMKDRLYCGDMSYKDTKLLMSEEERWGS